MMPVVQDDEMRELTNEMWKLLVKHPAVFAPENKDLLIKHFSSLIGSVALCVAEGGSEEPLPRGPVLAKNGLDIVEILGMSAGTFLIQVCSDPDFDAEK